jgi:hypothetical protein
LFDLGRAALRPMHAAISRAAGIGGYVCAFQREESLGRLL